MAYFYIDKATRYDNKIRDNETGRRHMVKDSVAWEVLWKQADHKTVVGCRGHAPEDAFVPNITHVFLFTWFSSFPTYVSCLHWWSRRKHDNLSVRFDTVFFLFLWEDIDQRVLQIDKCVLFWKVGNVIEVFEYYQENYMRAGREKLMNRPS